MNERVRLTSEHGTSDRRAERRRSDVRPLCREAPAGVPKPDGQSHERSGRGARRSSRCSSGARWAQSAAMRMSTREATRSAVARQRCAERPSPRPGRERPIRMWVVPLRWAISAITSATSSDSWVRKWTPGTDAGWRNALSAPALLVGEPSARTSDPQQVRSSHTEALRRAPPLARAVTAVAVVRDACGGFVEHEVDAPGRELRQDRQAIAVHDLIDEVWGRRWRDGQRFRGMVGAVGHNGPSIQTYAPPTCFGTGNRNSHAGW